LLLMFRAAAQDPATPPADTPDFWNLYYQATSIGDSHGRFYAPYSGPLSLKDYPEHDVSLTTTLFFDTRFFDRNTQFIFNPEIAGGKGFSGVNGIADAPNGELPRVASPTPKPYIARLYITHDFGFGEAMEHVESDENQLAGTRPMNRYSVYAGRFTLTDFFEDNAYAHDPRTQFMAWSNMFNGAWDYPADVRGYTWGIVQEFHTRHWAYKYGIAAEPRVANGSQLDRQVLREHGQVAQVSRRWEFGKREGNLRLLGYWNRARAGNYAEALKLGEQTHTTPSVVATREPGTLKYGTAVSFDQALTSDLGVFVRLGWNDGKTESFAFTAMDRLASGGVSMQGTRWRRPKDTVATALTAGGISGVHANYLAHGGLDFLIGDGALSYAPEYVWESYYNAQIFPGIFTAVDFQHDTNMAYNHARGPVWIYSLRLHVEFGVKPWSYK
jgi:high affinity Mn2+ porin